MSERKEKSANDYDQEYEMEKFVFNLSEDLIVAMEDKNVTYAILAERLGRSEVYVKEVIKNARYMPLATLSDICSALGLEPTITFTDR